VNRLWDRVVIRGWLAVPDRFMPRPAWEKVDALAFGGDAPQAGERTPEFSATWTGPGLQPEFDRRINAMSQAAPGAITVSSGYRDPVKQHGLWVDALARYGTEDTARQWVAPSDGTTCTSNHCRGLAADLSFADDATMRWAHQHAPEFGLTFPLDNESWHVEPLGLRA
jgi:hypothetical protein